MKSILAIAAGSSPAQLSTHKLVAKTLVYALGITLLFVSFPIAFFGGTAFAAANIPTGLPATAARLSAAAIGLAWACLMVFGVDRTLLIVADAVGSSRAAQWTMVIVRFAVAAVLSYLVADQIVMWYYRAPIAQAARVMALEEREAAASKIDNILEVNAKARAVSALATEEADLQARRGHLPPDIQEHINNAHNCYMRVSRLDKRVATLQADTANDWTDEIARLRAIRSNENAVCWGFQSIANKAKTVYYADISSRLDTNTATRAAAEPDLQQAKQKATAEKREDGDAIVRAYSDGSSREVAFERLQQDRTDIHRKSWAIRFALFILELLPLTLKMLARNNPVVSENRAVLATEAARHDSQVDYHKIYREQWIAGALDKHSEFRANVSRYIAGSQSAMASLASFEDFCTYLDSCRQRMNDTVARHPHHAHLVLSAYTRAVEAAFSNIAASYGRETPSVTSETQ
jgi:hypothetical protein